MRVIFMECKSEEHGQLRLPFHLDTKDFYLSLPY